MSNRILINSGIEFKVYEDDDQIIKIPRWYTKKGLDRYKMNIAFLGENFPENFAPTEIIKICDNNWEVHQKKITGRPFFYEKSAFLKKKQEPSDQEIEFFTRVGEVFRESGKQVDMIGAKDVITSYVSSGNLLQEGKTNIIKIVDIGVLNTRHSLMEKFAAWTQRRMLKFRFGEYYKF